MSPWSKIQDFGPHCSNWRTLVTLEREPRSRGSARTHPSTGVCCMNWCQVGLPQANIGRVHSPAQSASIAVARKHSNGDVQARAFEVREEAPPERSWPGACPLWSVPTLSAAHRCELSARMCRAPCRQGPSHGRVGVRVLAPRSATISPRRPRRPPALGHAGRRQAAS